MKEDRVLDLGSGEHGGSATVDRDRLTQIDIQARFRPDVVANAEHLPFMGETFGAVLAMSILEHVQRPWVVVSEIHRVLRLGGLVLGYVPYMYPYHADPTFSDYYRFSDEALRFLFGAFRSIELLPHGGYAHTLLRFMAGFTASERRLLRFEPIVSSVLAGISRATGISQTTRIRGLRRSPTGMNFLAQK